MEKLRSHFYAAPTELDGVVNCFSINMSHPMVLGSAFQQQINCAESNLSQSFSGIIFFKETYAYFAGSNLTSS